MRAIFVCFCILLPFVILQCKPKSNITASQEVSTPPSFNPEQIGFNNVKVQGQLIKDNGVDYFSIEKILLRGRSAPVISSGQKIKLKDIAQPLPAYNQVIQGILTCQSVPQSENYIWSFKAIKK